jgi:DNA-binding PadR family transcriptional regulator
VVGAGLPLADGNKHGYAIIQDARDFTKSRFVMSSGTLYGILARLRARRIIEEVEDRPALEFDDNRRRYCRLTRNGRLLLRKKLNSLAEALRMAAAQLKTDNH